MKPQLKILSHVLVAAIRSASEYFSAEQDEAKQNKDMAKVANLIANECDTISVECLQDILAIIAGRQEQGIEVCPKTRIRALINSASLKETDPYEWFMEEVIELTYDMPAIPKVGVSLQFIHHKLLGGTDAGRIPARTWDQIETAALHCYKQGWIEIA